MKWDVDGRVLDLVPSAECHSSGLSPKRRMFFGSGILRFSKMEMQMEDG